MAAQKRKRKQAPAVRRTPVAEISPEQQIVGAVFLSKVRAYDSETGWGELSLEAALSAGDSIRVKGRDTDLTQKVDKLAVGRSAVPSAAPGERVRLLFADAVREGDAVFRL